ncbi:MAG: GIY-YIG nuclease family protein [Patescibacteria group bacterium]|jgi:putative endonuclease|nr:GIY-YIG nuclease family protein [Patescibacteria group bacterium]
MESYYVYAIKSIKYNYIYVGMSENPEKRLKEHNIGKTKSNKRYIPFEIIFTEFVGSRHQARQREKYFKSGCGKEYLKTLIK